MNPPAPTGRFSQYIGLPGGISAEEALERADERLLAHRDVAMGVIDAAIDDLKRLGSDPQCAAPLRAAGDKISSMAGMFGLGDLARAGTSLCDLLDLLAQQNSWDTVCVELHRTAIPLIRRFPGDEARPLLEGLASLVSKRKARTSPQLSDLP